MPAAVGISTVLVPMTELASETTADPADVCTSELALDDTEPDVTISSEDETEAGLTLAAAPVETGRDMTMEPALELTGRAGTVHPAAVETDTGAPPSQ